MCKEGNHLSHKRVDWDTYFMDIAFNVAGRGTCPRLRVGSVLVKEKRIKATGYNGSPAGLPHCDDVGCYMVDNHCIRTSHSEENCLNNADVKDKQGATLYVTDQPCPNCQKLIISSGVKRVVFAREYKPAVDWLSQTDIEVVHLKDYVSQFERKLLSMDKEELMTILNKHNLLTK